MMRRALGAVIGLLVAAGPCAPIAGADQFPPTSEEAKFGAQVAKQIEAHYRLVTNPAQVDRVTRVGDALTRIVERQDMTFHFKIIDLPVVNAFSIPGGWVYVTAGMMKFIRSDDELAAVLAHELTHVNHHHYYIRAERQKQMVPALIVAAALSVLAHSPAPILGVQIAAQGALNDYQRDLEREADLTGVVYLGKTSYSPVAMLALMEHLAELERYSGIPDLGVYYQDHPTAAERVAYIRADLTKRGIPLVRRSVEGYLKIALDPAAPADGQPVTVLVDATPVLTIGAAVDGQGPADRAQAVVSRLTAFFNRDPAAFDVHAAALLDHWSVIGGEAVLFDVTPQDAAYAKTTPGLLAQDIRARLARVIAAAPYNRKF